MKQTIRTRGRRILCVLLTAVMLLSALPLTVGAWSEPNQNLIRNYRDVAKEAWYYDSVNWVVANKLMSNLGDPKKFEPDVTVTRATFCKLCMNFIGALERDVTNTGKTEFRDVIAGSWYVPSIAWAKENGIVNGYNATAFGPNDTITREQMAQLLYNLITNYFGVNLDGVSADLTQFSDSAKISGWAKTAVSAMVKLGMFKGNNGKFSPQDGTSRSQVATLIERFYRYYADTNACYIDEDLVLTMEDQFDGEGKTGWRDDVWYNETRSFVDEFDEAGNIIRPANWLPALEDRIYTEDGYLYMNASYPEKYEYFNNNNCIAALFTRNSKGEMKFSQSYGYYEMRLKPSDAAGFISTFWLTTVPDFNTYDPTADPLPPDPTVEMDIMETLPHDSANFFSTLHWRYAATAGNYEGERCYIKGSKSDREDENGQPFCVPDESFFDGAFHTVGFLWTKEEYSIYYDGNYIGSYKEVPKTNGEAIMYVSCYFADDSWMYDENICNRDDFGENNISSYIVDYVRVYQLKDYLAEYPANFHNS